MPTGLKTYSRLEVLTHNRADDCWVIVRNRVYDLTGFIKQHPGGMDILLSRAGEDASSYFLARHGMSSTIEKRLESYCIGEIEASERVLADDRDEPFLMELLERCYREKLYRPQNNNTHLLRGVSLFLFLALSIISLYGKLPGVVALSAVILQAVIGTSLFGFIAHEATHRNFPKGRLSQLLLRISWPVFWPFISQTPLRFEHNSHHIKIGDPEFDYEVAAFAPFMRYSGKVKYKSIHRFQHLMARFMYPVYANLITTIGGIRSDFWARHKRSVALEHSLSVLWSLSWYIVIPSLLSGQWLWFTLLYLVYQCVLFYGIYVGAAINHFVPATGAAIPEEKTNLFGYYVCHHTSNFASDSKFWYWYTGGFNIQIEHHLVPFVPVENLHRLKPIVQELCKKYNYPYQSYTTFGQLWSDHYAYLLSLSTEQGIPAETGNKTNYQAR